jgi:rubrerythrin
MLLAGLGAVALWIEDARRRRAARAIAAGLCKKCGYDRRGLPADATCPECGTVPAGG